jgi:hypothetical protein
LAYQRILPGSTLTLHVPLRVPANQAHVGIQAVGSGEMDPYCQLEISTVSEAPQAVDPDVFEIRGVGRSISPSSDWGMRTPTPANPGSLGVVLGEDSGLLGPTQPVQVAAVGFGVHSDLGVGVGIGGGYGAWSAGRTAPTQLFYKTRLALRSVKQPGVRQMTCQWDQMMASGAAFARHLTVGEIRAALGPSFALSLAGEARPEIPPVPR